MLRVASHRRVNVAGEITLVEILSPAPPQRSPQTLRCLCFRRNHLVDYSRSVGKPHRSLLVVLRLGQVQVLMVMLIELGMSDLSVMRIGCLRWDWPLLVMRFCDVLGCWRKEVIGFQEVVVVADNYKDVDEAQGVDGVPVNEDNYD